MSNFKISTNIQRDYNSSLNYIVTKNSNEVYDRIIHNIKLGQKSFSIIGSYGTGKSSFLWAFEKHLEGTKIFGKAVNGEFKGLKSFKFNRLIGDSSSFKHKLINELNLNIDSNSTGKELVKELKKKILWYNQRGSGVVILVDEFGKHLEHISKNNPDEMYVLQEVAELCNSEELNVVFITTLHQNFSAYSRSLSKAERAEWDKVRGRFIDIAFDEPIEQLIFFAAEILRGKSKKKGVTLKSYKARIQKLLSSNLIGKNDGINAKTLFELYPIDPLAAFIIAKSLQVYGQNERSLFTFLESNELKTSIDSESIFSVNDCFDYLLKNLSQEIEDPDRNPFKPQWKSTLMALEKSEFLFDNDFDNAAKLLKTISLVNIFGTTYGTLDKTILLDYGTNYIGIRNTDYLLQKLVDTRIIRFSNHRNKYNFIDGTDLDFEKELVIADKQIEHEFSIVSRVNQYFDFGVIMAKRAQYQYGTPRLFEFKCWDDFQYENTTESIDGYINLIFSEGLTEKDLLERSKGIESLQVFLLFKETQKIKDILIDLDKIDLIIRKYTEDGVAKRILHEERLFKRRQLEDAITGNLFGNSSQLKWIYKGESKTINSLRSLNKYLSELSIIHFYNTPVYKNEMINKSFLSSQMMSARRDLIKAMIESGEVKMLNIPDNNFKPHKTIYLSLLKNTGIHRDDNGVWGYFAPTDESFAPLWNKSVEILKSSVESKMSIDKFYSELTRGTFKLKKGFLDFWVSIFLVIKKEDYSLYSKEGEYVPHLTLDILDLIHKSPNKYFIKALKEDGVQKDFLHLYKDLTGFNESNVKGLESSYITIYSNFLRFYRGLPNYTKETKELPSHVLKVRDAIANASDPETALFEKIPEALGYHHIASKEQLDSFIEDLKESIRILRTTYEELIDHLERSVLAIFGDSAKNFEDYQENALAKYKSIKTGLISNSKLKVFVTRILSPLDIRSAYWESICDAVMSVKLSEIRDEQIDILINRVKSNFETLNDLIDIHNIKANEGEKVFSLKLVEGGAEDSITTNIIADIAKQKEAERLVTKLRRSLSKDAQLNKMVIIQLIQELLNTKNE